MNRLPDNFNEPNAHAFCVLPWVHRFVNLCGEVQVCCTAEEHPHSHITHDSGEPVNAADGLSDEQIGDTRHMRGIRKSMLQGQWPAACERCMVTEEAGGNSRRCAENEHFAQHIPWILEHTDKEGRAPAHIRSRDFRLGNLCNLRCRMCHPRASKLLLEEWNRASRKSLRVTGEKAAKLADMDWFRDAALWDAFTASLPDLEHLHFAGGEPLVIPEVLQALELCVEHGVAGRIELTFNTNVTKLPRRHRELWPRFRKVNLVCSVDAFEPLNDYIRFPAKWKTIARNLDRIDREHEALNIGWATVSATVQVYNIFHLAELVEYTHRRFSFIQSMPNLIHLSFPQWFNVQYLPEAMKDATEARLLDLKARLAAQGAEHGLNQIDGIVRYMRMGDYAPHIMEEFRRATAVYDLMRGEVLSEIVPELAPLMQAPDPGARMRLLVGKVQRKARRFQGRFTS